MSPRVPSVGPEGCRECCWWTSLYPPGIGTASLERGSTAAVPNLSGPRAGCRENLMPEDLRRS